MQATTFLRRSAPFALLAALLTGCAGQPTVPAASKIESRAQSLEQQGDFATAARQLEDAADAARGAEREHLRLAAARDWLKAGRNDRSRALVTQLDPARLSADDQLDLALLQARLDLAANRPRAALQRLNFDAAAIAPPQRTEVLAERARAYFALNDTVAAVRMLQQRGRLLTSSEARADNSQRIWDGMLQSDQPLDPDQVDAAEHPELHAWLELGRIGRTAWQEPYQFEARIQQWQSAHPDHPANRELVERLIQRHRQQLRYPARIAVLLPLSGPYSEVGSAVREGFLAAYYQNPDRSVVPDVRIYDTQGTPAGARQAAAQAHADGAAFVVGPLTKDALTALATDTADGATPTLGLNYLEESAAGPDWLYQFGLLPEDEAREVARQVAEDGYNRGVALVPDGGWGQRMVSAFSSSLENHGGDLLGFQTYSPGQNDFSTPITRVLNLDASRRRENRLQATLHRNLQFEPRRRQDVQFVFVADRQGETALIRPQLRFHHAIDLPVFATSHVYSPPQAANRDLDGVVFPDMPWAIGHVSGVDAVHRELSALWPGRVAEHGRLFALGFDAYRLVPLLANLKHPLASPVPGMTGVLQMGDGRRIHRSLFWARFQQGVPHLIRSGTATTPVIAAPAGGQ